jgi:hypothetical protein
MQADLDRLVIETGKAKTEFHHWPPIEG